MTEATVFDLQGVGRIPSSKPAALAWLRKFSLSHRKDGQRLLFDISSLPQEERSAYSLREIEAAGLPAGVHDEAAHDRFAEATPAMQAVALRKAEIARFLVKGGASTKSLPGPLCDATREKFGADGTAKMTLRRILRAVDGVDPINFAPALAPSYARKGAGAVEISEEAWAFFMTTIRDAGPQLPLKQAWRDVRDVASKHGWQWATYQTAWRRWDALPEAQKLVARFGREEAVNRLAMPIRRGKTTIKSLEVVSLDGRTQDFWVDFGDGKAVRPVMLALVDTGCGSSPSDRSCP